MITFSLWQQKSQLHHKQNHHRSQESRLGNVCKTEGGAHPSFKEDQPGPRRHHYAHGAATRCCAKATARAALTGRVGLPEGACVEATTQLKGWRPRSPRPGALEGAATSAARRAPGPEAATAQARAPRGQTRRREAAGGWADAAPLPRPCLQQGGKHLAHGLPGRTTDCTRDLSSFNYYKLLKRANSLGQSHSFHGVWSVGEAGLTTVLRWNQNPLLWPRAEKPHQRGQAPKPSRPPPHTTAVTQATNYGTWAPFNHNL